MIEGMKWIGFTGRKSPLSAPSFRSAAMSAKTGRKYCFATRCNRDGSFPARKNSACTIRGYKGCDAIKMGTNISLQPFARRKCLRKRIVDCGSNSGKDFVQHRLIKRFLVFEVVIEQRLVDSRGTRNRICARCGNPFARKFPDRGFQNSGPALFGLAASAETGFRDCVHMLTNQLVIYNISQGGTCASTAKVALSRLSKKMLVTLSLRQQWLKLRIHGQYGRARIFHRRHPLLGAPARGLQPGAGGDRHYVFRGGIPGIEVGD